MLEYTQQDETTTATYINTTYKFIQNALQKKNHKQ